MNILCAICQDSLEPSNDIFITPCGHVFHFPCVIQWLEKSQTCPQCRQRVKRDSITRIYFNFSNTEAVKEDSFTLQQKVDSLMFQIKLKEKEYSNSQTENITLKRQNSGLREEIKRTEAQVREKTSAIHALKEQSQYFKERCQDLENVSREKERLEKQIETYENVKSLLCSTSDDVDKLLTQTTDTSTLSTYVAILKRELSTSCDKRKELRSMVKRLQHELQTMKIERNSVTDDLQKRIEHLEEQLAISKSENEELQKLLTEQGGNPEPPIKAIEDAPKQTSKPSSRKREMDIFFDLDFPMAASMPKKSKKQEVKNESDEFNDSDIILVSPNAKKSRENEENSPYLPTKSKNILGFKDRPSQKNAFTIAPKRTLMSSKKFEDARKNARKEPAIVFDGFGGHSKTETFPTSKVSPTNKLKRPATDSAKSKKLKVELSANKQMDDYIINLT